MWRWTNGAAQLALGPRASVTILEVHFAHAMRYPVRSAEPAPGDVAPLQEAVGFN
jgi:hypothetical protein